MFYFKHQFTKHPQYPIPEYLPTSTETQIIITRRSRTLIDIMNDHASEQSVNFPTRERNTLDLIWTSLPGQFVNINSADKLIDDCFWSIENSYFPIKKHRRKEYHYRNGDYEAMRTETLKFAYFNGYSNTRSVLRKK